MVYLCCIVFGYYVFAVWFTELGVPADFVDNYSAFFALQDVREESVCKFLAEVAEIEGLFL